MCCPAQEAIAHEYFEDIRKEASSSTGNLAALLRLSSSGDLAALEEAVAAGAAVGLSVGGAAAGVVEHQVSQALEAEWERQQHEDEEMEDWEGKHGKCMYDLVADVLTFSREHTGWPCTLQHN
jgi:hypothetical protein